MSLLELAGIKENLGRRALRSLDTLLPQRWKARDEKLDGRHPHDIAACLDKPQTLTC